MRTKLYVAAAKVNTQPTRSNPRWRSWRSIPDRLHPPEDFLDSFPLSLAYLITRVSSGALVQPASAATLVLGDMRCNSHASQFLDELPLVVSFICSQRDSRSLATVPPSAARHDTPPNRRPWSPVCSPPVRSDSPSSDARGSSISLPFLVPCGPAWLADRWWNSVSD